MGHFIFRKQTQGEIAKQIIDCTEKKECVLLDIDLKSLGIAAPSVKRMTMEFYADNSNNINLATTFYLDSNMAEWKNISTPCWFLNQPNFLLGLINIQVVLSSFWSITNTCNPLFFVEWSTMVKLSQQQKKWY